MSRGPHVISQERLWIVENKENLNSESAMCLSFFPSLGKVLLLEPHTIPTDIFHCDQLMGAQRAKHFQLCCPPIRKRIAE